MRGAHLVDKVQFIAADSNGVSDQVARQVCYRLRRGGALVRSGGAAAAAAVLASWQWRRRRGTEMHVRAPAPPSLRSETRRCRRSPRPSRCLPSLLGRRRGSRLAAAARRRPPGGNLGDACPWVRAGAWRFSLLFVAVSGPPGRARFFFEPTNSTKCRLKSIYQVRKPWRAKTQPGTVELFPAWH